MVRYINVQISVGGMFFFFLFENPLYGKALDLIVYHNLFKGAWLFEAKNELSRRMQ